MKKSSPIGELFQYAFSIRIYASACRYCLSPTGGCILELNLTINLSVRYKFIARLNFGRTPMPFVRWGGS